jgi:hypothetical protein
MRKYPEGWNENKSAERTIDKTMEIPLANLNN